MADLKAALEDIAGTTELHLELDGGSKVPDEVGRLVNLETLHLRNAAQTLELPASLRELTKLRTVSLTAKGDRVRLPGLLRELPIEKLELEGVDPTDLAGFGNVTKLQFVVKDPKRDVVALSLSVPHLRELQLVSDEIAKGTLPPELGEFFELRVLALGDMGLSNLSAEVAKLRYLESLTIRGPRWKALPAVVTKLRSLATLEVGFTLTTLPEELVELTGLRTLILRGALNDGARLSKHDDVGAMRPLPKVLGKLKGLEVLNLDRCGVVSLAPIAPLTGLRELSVSWSALSDSGELSGFRQLERLGLERCERLGELNGLRPLSKLRRLSLARAQLPDLSALLELPALEELDLEDAEIGDLSAIFKHPGIKRLTAADGLVERWRNRAAFADLPSAEELRAALRTEDPKEAEQAVRWLARYVEACSMGAASALGPALGMARAGGEEEGEDLPDGHGFADYAEEEEPHTERASVAGRPFPDDALAAYGEEIEPRTDKAIAGGLYADEPEPATEEHEIGEEGIARAKVGGEDNPLTPLPLLDAFLERHAAKLSADALAGIFAATFRKGEDSYRAATVALEALVARRDEAAEAKVVAAFQKACESGDAGRRAREGNVHELLAEQLFPRFGASALIALLEGQRSDGLSSEGGGGMDSLFAPAFAKAKAPGEVEALVRRLEAYLDDRLEPQGAGYFQGLLESIRGQAGSAAAALAPVQARLAKARGPRE